MREIKLIDNLLNSRKILFHFGAILKEYTAGKRDFNPISIEIHPTQMCNHRCVHCSYTLRNASRLTIPQEVMEQLVDSIIAMDIKAVYFSGGGEPTLYPGIARHITRLHRHGVEVSLITNGTYFEESGIYDIAHMFNYIAISLPSVDRKQYTSIVGRNNLDKVLAAPAAIKQRFGKDAPIIGSRIVVTNKIYKDIISILDTAREKQFDYALFKVVRDYEDVGYGLAAQEQDTIKALIEQNSHKLDANFTNLDRIFQYTSIPLSRHCIINDIGYIANVDADGKVYPNIVAIGQEEFCVGDLHTQTLQQMWNSPQHQLVKTASQEKCRQEECRNCRAIAYNHIIGELLQALPSQNDYFI